MLASGVHQESDGHALHLPVLVLNASYEPINVCAARRAIVLVLKGVAMTEEENGHFLHAARVAMRVPSVIRLLEYRRIPHQSRALSRKNILLRDRNTCQYCSTTLPSGELTLDHVIPRSRGGMSTWENIVCSCHHCNRRKGGRTPDEAGMHLFRRPRRPEWTPFSSEMFSLRRYREWMPYLSQVDSAYWNTELIQD